MAFRTLDQIADRLVRRLSGTLPGVDAQRTMAPAHRQDLVRETRHRAPIREAAVLVAIGGTERPAVVLTERQPDLVHHAGQISFPGGRREKDEDLLDTALRETREEIELPEDLVTILGRLSPLYVPPSNFEIHPFVGVVRSWPRLEPAANEVARIIMAEVEHLCDPAARSTERRTVAGRLVEVPFFDLNGDKIWGATAMMIAELIALLTD